MRIISKYHDYYDSGMGQGVDTERIFNRQESSLNGSFPLNFEELHSRKAGGPEYPVIRLGNITWNGYNSMPYIISFTVLFAGKVYPCVEVGVEYGVETQRFYTLDSLLRYFLKTNLDYFISRDKSRYTGLSAMDSLIKLYTFTGSEVLRNWSIRNKISIATDWSINLPAKEDVIQINPCLKSLSFQKIMNPMTAYQELEMWVCGVLTEPDKPNIVPDIQKIANHGFDKFSFRKGKGE